MHRLQLSRHLLNTKEPQKRSLGYVLGIQTSLNDADLAIVDTNGRVLGSVVNTFQDNQTKEGDTKTPAAYKMFRKLIYSAYESCLTKSSIAPEQLTAIAVTTKPGRALNLSPGLDFAKRLARSYDKPLVAVDHMEAHALQARREHIAHIRYPYLCLLISRGYCQLVVVRWPSNLLLLGETLDYGPGEVLAKIAQRLRLYDLPQYRGMHYGRAIELAAESAQFPDAYEFPMQPAREPNCNFTFSDIKEYACCAIADREKREKTTPDGIIDNCADFCAALLIAISSRIMHCTQRAIEYCFQSHRNPFGDAVPILVVSGGVANIDVIYANVAHLAKQYKVPAFRPTAKFCSDNGVMIAWHGIEQILTHGYEKMLKDYDNLKIEKSMSFQASAVDDLTASAIKCDWINPLPFGEQCKNHT